jgi:hypothetical protein
MYFPNREFRGYARAFVNSLPFRGAMWACDGSQGTTGSTKKQLIDTRRGEILPEWVLMCLFSLYVSLLA